VNLREQGAVVTSESGSKSEATAAFLVPGDGWSLYVTDRRLAKLDTEKAARIRRI